MQRGRSQSNWPTIETSVPPKYSEPSAIIGLHQMHLQLVVARQCLSMIVAAVVCVFRSSVEIRLENIALGQQLNVLQRSAPGRLRLTSADRTFWTWLRNVWHDWKSALVIVQPETV